MNFNENLTIELNGQKFKKHPALGDGLCFWQSILIFKNHTADLITRLYRIVAQKLGEKNSSVCVA